MKKTITLISIAALLCTVLCGCGSFRLISIDRGDALQYSSGNAEITDAITDIYICWAAGSVNVVYGGKSVILEETANKALDDASSMMWNVEGSRLTVKFTRDNSPSALGLVKSLTLTLPEGLSADSIHLDCASAETRADALFAKRLRLSSASGDILISSAEADEIEIDSASGKVSIAQSGKCRELDISTASGKILAKLDDISDLEVDTASGGMDISAIKLGDADLDASSGSVALAVYSSFNSINVETASGAVSLFLPQSQGFSADVDTASGELESDIPITFRGGQYICGDGSARLEIDTASGDITLGQAK